MESCPVIKDYYLVIGGGKVGTDFLRYARKNKFPFVLVIDRDGDAPASREAKVLKTENELTLLRNKALAALPKNNSELSRVEEESKQKNEGKNEREIMKKIMSQKSVFIKWIYTAFLLFSFSEFLNILFQQCHAMQLLICSQIF